MGFRTLTTSGAIKEGASPSLDLAVATGNLAVSHLPTTTTRVTSTATGAQNDWDPGIVGNTLILWSGASTLPVTGFTAGSAGQIIIFRNTGTNLATFAHQSGSSTAGHKIFNKATSAVTPVGALGYATWIYDGTDWVLIDNDSNWITPAFAAGDYTGSGSLTWTVEAGDVEKQQYRLVGTTLTIRSAIITTSTGGTASLSLLVANGAWGGFSIAGGTAFFQSNEITINAGSATNVGRLRADTTDATHILFQLINGANWSNAAVNNTSVYATTILEVT